MPRHRQLLSKHLGTSSSTGDGANAESTSSEDEAPKAKNGRLPMKFAMSSSSEENEDENRSSDEEVGEKVEGTEPFPVESRDTAPSEAASRLPEAWHDKDGEAASDTEPSSSSSKGPAAKEAAGASKKKKSNKKGKRKGGGGGSVSGSKAGERTSGGADSVASTKEPSSGAGTKALVGRDVEVVGTSRVDLNGRHGRCIDFDVSRGRYLVQLPSSSAASNTATATTPPAPPLALKPENLVLLMDKGSEGGGRSALAVSEARLYGQQHELVRLRFRRSPFGACDHVVRCSRGRPLKDVKVLLAQQVYSDTGVDEAALAPNDTEVLFKGQVLDEDATTLAAYGVEHNAKLGFRLKGGKVSGGNGSSSRSSSSAANANATAGRSNASAASATSTSPSETSSPPPPPEQQQKDEARHLPFGGDVSAAMRANDRAAIRAIFEWRQRREEGGASGSSVGSGSCSGGSGSGGSGDSGSGSGSGGSGSGGSGSGSGGSDSGSGGSGSGGSDSGSGSGGSDSSTSAGLSIASGGSATSSGASNKGSAASQGRLSGIKVIDKSTTTNTSRNSSEAAGFTSRGATAAAAGKKATATRSVAEELAEAAARVERLEREAAAVVAEVGSQTARKAAEIDGVQDADGGDGDGGNRDSREAPSSAGIVGSRKARLAVEEQVTAAMIALDCLDLSSAAATPGNSALSINRGSSSDGGSDSSTSSSTSSSSFGSGNSTAVEEKRVKDSGTSIAESLRASRKELYRRLHLVAASLSETVDKDPSTTKDDAADPRGATMAN